MPDDSKISMEGFRISGAGGMAAQLPTTTVLRFGLLTSKRELLTWKGCGFKFWRAIHASLEANFRVMLQKLLASPSEPETDRFRAFRDCD